MSTIFKRNVNHYRWEIQKKTSCAEHGAIFVFIPLVPLESDVKIRSSIEPHKSEIIVFKTRKKHFVGFKRDFAMVI